MAIVAPKGRPHRSAAALLRLVRRGVATIPAARLSETEMAVTAARRSACVLCARTSPARLAVDTERPEGTGQTRSGLAQVPCDTHRRARLAPLGPEALRPFCPRVLRQCPRGQALEPLALREDADGVALDGTGSWESKPAPCKTVLHATQPHAASSSDARTTHPARALSPQTACVRRRPTSSPCPRTVSTTAWVAKQGRRPRCSSRSRQRSTAGA